MWKVVAGIRSEYHRHNKYNKNEWLVSIVEIIQYNRGNLKLKEYRTSAKAVQK